MNKNSISALLKKKGYTFDSNYCYLVIEKVILPREKNDFEDILRNIPKKKIEIIETVKCSNKKILIIKYNKERCDSLIVELMEMELPSEATSYFFNVPSQFR